MCFDNVSESPDAEYQQKVYRLMKNDEEACENVNITDKTEWIYRTRHRQNWSEPDSVYDAWLTSEGLQRDWFPLEGFFKKYPDLVCDTYPFNDVN